MEIGTCLAFSYAADELREITVNLSGRLLEIIVPVSDREYQVG